MSATIQRLEFSPVQPEGLGRGLLLALLAHVLLVAALTWGVNWRRDAATETVVAELWAELPQAAAPPPPEPEVAPPPAPEPAPELSAPDPQIALERERALRQQELALEQERLAQLERERVRKEKQAAMDKKAQADAKAKQEQASAKALEKQRQENLQRLAGLAGATGTTSSTGTAALTSGPSASYGSRIAARIKPNIVFTEDIKGNPTADVEVRIAPDGAIVGRKLIKSSGIASWDEAVLKAIDKTERLPRDTDGRVQPSMVIGFRPKA